MSKILPRGQPPLRRQREVSGSSKVDKGAPRCVPAGLPQGMVRFPPPAPGDEWVELRQAWLFGMGCSKILQVSLKAHWLCAGGKFPPAVPSASAPLPPSAARSTGMGGRLESLTSSPSCLQHPDQRCPPECPGAFNRLLCSFDSPVAQEGKLRRLGTAWPRAGRKRWLGLASAGGNTPSSCLERS